MRSLWIRGLGLIMLVLLAGHFLVVLPAVGAEPPPPPWDASALEVQPPPTERTRSEADLITASTVVTGTWNPAIGLPNTTVESIAVANNSLYAIHDFGGQRGLWRWQNNEWTIVHADTISNTWHTLQTGSDGKLYSLRRAVSASAWWNVAVLDGSNWTDVTPALAIDYGLKAFVVVNPQKIYAIGQNQTLAIWNGTTWHTQTVYTSSNTPAYYLFDLRYCSNQLYFMSAEYYQHGEDSGYYIYKNQVTFNPLAINSTSDSIRYKICEGNTRYGWHNYSVYFGTETSIAQTFSADWWVDAIARNGSYTYAAGRFYRMDGVVTNGLARWNGQEWQGIEPALSPTYPPPSINQLLIHQNQVYVTGNFNGPAGVVSPGIAQWTASFSHRIYAPMTIR